MPVCVVVGVGAGGVGENVAKKFSLEGYKIGMMARTKENLDRLEKEIPNSKGYVCDVSITAQIEPVVTAITSELGPIDVLIFNTSGGGFKGFADTTQEEFDLAMKTGPSALFAFAKAVTPGMVERGSGVIGISGATAAWRGMPSTYAKAAGNFAMRAVAQSLARDMAPKGIHVFHVIIDGIIDEPRTRGWMPDKPDNQFMQPRDIAETYWAMTQQSPSCWGFEINLMAGPCFGTMASI